jgi:hypothetical protein
MTATDGSYRLEAPAGRYDVVTPCQITVPVSVRAGSTAKVDYTCNVP